MKSTEYNVHYTIAVRFLSELFFFLFFQETFIFFSIQFTGSFCRKDRYMFYFCESKTKADGDSQTMDDEESRTGWER